MTASFKAGLPCKHCDVHAPDKTINKQYGVNANNGLIDVPNMALRVSGKFVCLKCGADIGIDDDKEMPAQVGEVIRTLVQDCLFAVASVTDNNAAVPFVWLDNRVLDNAAAQVRWFRDEKWIEGVPERATKLTPVSYDPSDMKRRPPAVIDHALRVLTSKGLILTEIPKRDGSSYAYLALIVDRYDGRLHAPVASDGPIDPENLKSGEDHTAPIIVQVHLQWNRDAGCR